MSEVAQKIVRVICGRDPVRLPSKLLLVAILASIACKGSPSSSGSPLPPIQSTPAPPASAPVTAPIAAHRVALLVSTSSYKPALAWDPYGALTAALAAGHVGVAPQAAGPEATLVAEVTETEGAAYVNYASLGAATGANIQLDLTLQRPAGAPSRAGLFTARAPAR